MVQTPPQGNCLFPSESGISTLITRLVWFADEGEMTKLEWFDLGCIECFSSANSVCLQEEEQESCACEVHVYLTPDYNMSMRRM